jgi:NADPH2:quinone reductase
VNRGDLALRDGASTYVHSEWGGVRFPHVLGWDVAGEVDAVGAGVDPGLVGARVAGLMRSGGYAELAVASARQFVSLPPALEFVAAAAVPTPFLTAYYALTVDAAIHEGETVLVQAAAGAVGTAAVQFARTFGCRVLATAGSPGKVEFALSLGAEAAFDYSDPEWPAAVLEATQNRGVDVVIESAGGDILAKSVGCLAGGGRLVTVGNSARASSPVDLRVLLDRGLHLNGFGLWGATRTHADAVAGPNGGLARVLEMVAAGAVRPIVARTFALADAVGAHRFVERRENIGSVVLTP